MPDDTFPSLSYENPNAPDLSFALGPFVAWRLVLDGMLQSDPKELTWIGYEYREPHSLHALLSAYQFMLDTVDAPLTIDTLKAFHKHTTTGVSNIEVTPGEFKKINEINAYFVGDGATPEAIQELNALKDELKLTFYEGKPTSIYPDDLPHTFEQLPPEGGYVFPCMKIKNGLVVIDYKKIPLITNQILETYHRDIVDADTESKKIKVIAQCVRKLELLHPFRDVNLRVFGTLLLNKLLLQNQLKPTALFDPSIFDNSSSDQIVGEVIRGQNNFDHVVKNNSYPEALSVEAVTKNLFEGAVKHAKGGEEGEYADAITEYMCSMSQKRETIICSWGF